MLAPAPFEPERAAPDAAARQRAARFVDRELDVLAEQGNFERARVLLARRVAADGADADAYLDAIRVERSAAPSGAAWQAWASRALSQGIEVAAALSALVPEPELCRYLVEQNIGWAALGRQRDRVAARALLRMRLERQLRDDPASALAAAEDPSLLHATADDRALRVLAIGVLAATVWDFRARVIAIAPSYALDLSTAAGGTHAQDDAEQHARALLLDAARLQAAESAEARHTPCPAALARFVRIGLIVSRPGLARIARELQHDLHARPSAYLRYADALARAPGGLGAWLTEALLAGRAALDAGAQDAARDEAAAEQVLARARTRLRRESSWRLWLTALAIAAMGLAAIWPWRDARAIGVALLALLALWPLNRWLEASLYARTLRPALIDATLRGEATLAALCTRLRAGGFARGRQLAARAQRDGALAVIAAAAALGSARTAAIEPAETP